MGVTQQAPAAPTRNLIFISYRRDDAAGVAGRLHDRVCGRFGDDQVFMDVTDIPPGKLFRVYIDEKMASCAAVLVVIGPRWLNCSINGRRRLDDPGDLVRIEIATALSDAETLVIPVLVEGATMPPEDQLPDVLKPLASLNASELSEGRWKYDTKRLLKELEKVLPHAGPPPPPPGLLNRLRRYWELFIVRLVAAVLLLSAVLTAQLLLAYRPEPVNLETTGRFSPAVVRLGGEVLTIEAPRAGSGGLLLAHVANANEVVDFACEKARLDGDTLMLYSDLNPPTSPSRVDLLTTKPNAPAEGEPCRTFIQVHAADEGRPPSTLRFYQSGAPGGDILRSVELKADGEVLVGVDTVKADASEDNSPGCEKLLRVAPNFASPADPTNAVVAEADSAASFTFSPVTAREPLFEGGGGGFQPFAFADDGILRARAVEIVAPSGGNGPSPVLAARSVAGSEPLSVESLVVGPDRLEVKVSGVGFVEVSGNQVADPLGRINRHPFPWLLLAVIDAALLAWVLHILFGRRRQLA